jgi:hypothetical protein
MKHIETQHTTATPHASHESISVIQTTSIARLEECRRGRYVKEDLTGVGCIYWQDTNDTDVHAEMRLQSKIDHDITDQDQKQLKNAENIKQNIKWIERTS